MQVSSPTNSSSGSAPAVSTAAAQAKQSVSTMEFMKLLSTEMANQDPMQPMDPTATMTQLAQFTSLQQMSQMSQSQSIAAANSFLGTQVSVPGGTNGAAVSGTVTAVDLSGVASGSAPQLIISGLAQEYPLTAVTQVQTAAPATTIK